MKKKSHQVPPELCKTMINELISWSTGHRTEAKEGKWKFTQIKWIKIIIQIAVQSCSKVSTPSFNSVIFLSKNIIKIIQSLFIRQIQAQANYSLTQSTSIGELQNCAVSSIGTKMMAGITQTFCPKSIFKAYYEEYASGHSYIWLYIGSVKSDVKRST